MIKFLFIGDIYGKSGRNAIAKYLPNLVKVNKIDVVIANGENISHGSSILKKHYDFLKKQEIDVITSGNHIFHKKEVLKYIDSTKDLLRPLNMNSFLPGNGTIQITKKGKTIRITNIMGKSFMDHVNNPYESFDNLLKTDKSDIHIVDMHAETTAEKKAFAWNYDGKITCLFGTHTHTQTSDEQVLPKGTAFITDIGMTGPFHSILGANPTEIIIKEKTGIREYFQPAISEPQFCGAILELKDDHKVFNFQRIFIKPNEKNK